MKWSNEEDRATLYSLAQASPGDRAIVQLAEDVGDHFDAEGSVKDFPFVSSPLSVNALVMIITYSPSGQAVFESLTALERVLVLELMAEILEIKGEIAANQSHKREADELQD